MQHVPTGTPFAGIDQDVCDMAAGDNTRSVSDASYPKRIRKRKHASGVLAAMAKSENDIAMARANSEPIPGRTLIDPTKRPR